jgi:hypothetical protein
VVGVCEVCEVSTQKIKSIFNIISVWEHIIITGGKMRFVSFLLLFHFSFFIFHLSFIFFLLISSISVAKTELSQRSCTRSFTRNMFCFNFRQFSISSYCPHCISSLRISHPIFPLWVNIKTQKHKKNKITKSQNNLTKLHSVPILNKLKAHLPSQRVIHLSY